MEISGHIASFNPVHVIIRKHLHQWNEMDLQHSVGAWKLLKSFSAEQLQELYRHAWGNFNEWSDEKLGGLLK